MRRALLVVVVAIAGCRSNRGEIREIARPAPPPPPRHQRFELVETATVATGSTVELWVPLASGEPGLQEIERLDVTIRPDTPYAITSDSLGNRTLHLERKGPVTVSVSYRVLATEGRAGPGVGVTILGGEVAVERWDSGTGSASASGSGEPALDGHAGVDGQGTPLLPAHLILARGTDKGLPTVKVDGVETVPRLAWKTRALEAP